MQAKVTNSPRGHAMATYRLVDLGGSLGAQLLISVLPAASCASHNILAVLCCSTLISLTLTTVQQPATPSAPRLCPSLAIKRSPLAGAGVLVAALSGASFRMVGPVYGNEIGSIAAQLAYFLATFVLGGAIAQYPVGWLADKYDRRWILIWLSIAAILSCILTASLSNSNTTVVLILAALFGLTTFPIYSVATAHAHDFASSKERVNLSAAPLFFFALGAIAAPIIASQLISSF